MRTLVIGMSQTPPAQGIERALEGALQWFGQARRFTACTVCAVQDVGGVVRVADNNAGTRVSSYGQESNRFVEKTPVTLWFLRYAGI